LRRLFYPSAILTLFFGSFETCRHSLNCVLAVSANSSVSSYYFFYYFFFFFFVRENPKKYRLPESGLLNNEKERTHGWMVGAIQ
jgi:hypothetical protein